MTTIACKAGIMACDSAWGDANDLIGTSKNKITRLKSGAIIGEAGDTDSRMVIALLQNVKTFAQMPFALDLAGCCVDYAAVIMFPDGEVAQISIDRVEAGGVVYIASAWPVNRGITAVGSGAEVAIGAMAAGKTAAQAVAIACQWDPHSKLPVHVRTCETTTKKPGGSPPGIRSLRKRKCEPKLPRKRK